MLKTFKYYLNKAIDLVLAISLTTLLINSINTIIELLEEIFNF